MICRTNSFSNILESTGVTEIGLKSCQISGDVIFGTGVMELDFHWSGTIEKHSEVLNM